jgi:protoporphyrinogen oxidase
LKRRAELERAPVSLSLPDQTASLSDGSRVRFSHLVNTAPLPDLVEMLVKGDAGSVPEAVRDAVVKLRANSVFYFDVGIKGAVRDHQDYHWIYFPEEEFPFYRVGSYSAVERSLAPEGCRSYYVECGHYGEGDPSRYEQAVIDGLRKVGLLTDEDELLFLVPNVLSPAYVLVDDHYAAARGTILDWLASSTPIITMGRYGRWQYNAMEDAMREGQEAALQIRGEDRA